MIFDAIHIDPACIYVEASCNNTSCSETAFIPFKGIISIFFSKKYNYIGFNTVGGGHYRTAYASINSEALYKAMASCLKSPEK